MTEDRLDVLKSLGFEFIDTIDVNRIQMDFADDCADRYKNETHVILHWRPSDRFSTKNLVTKKGTYVDTFENTIKKYKDDN